MSVPTFADFSFSRHAFRRCIEEGLDPADVLTALREHEAPDWRETFERFQTVIAVSGAAVRVVVAPDGAIVSVMRRRPKVDRSHARSNYISPRRKRRRR